MAESARGGGGRGRGRPPGGLRVRKDRKNATQRRQRTQNVAGGSVRAGPPRAFPPPLSLPLRMRILGGGPTRHVARRGRGCPVATRSGRPHSSCAACNAEGAAALRAPSPRVLTVRGCGGGVRVATAAVAPARAARRPRNTLPHVTGGGPAQSGHLTSRRRGVACTNHSAPVAASRRGHTSASTDAGNSGWCRAAAVMGGGAGEGGGVGVAVVAPCGHANVADRRARHGRGGSPRRPLHAATGAAAGGPRV